MSRSLLPPGRAPARLLLAAALVVAAALRFTGLGWGLRHKPHMDEEDFVLNVGLMLSRGDLDHRYYEYPGLFFYILYPVLGLLGVGAAPGLGAYLAARGVVATFGVANVLLLYVLGSRIAGARAGLVAAALLAFSPVDVETSHMVRADVVLETFVLMALMAFRGVGENAWDDARSGVGLGAACAVKFTGALLAPSYLLQRLLAPGRRLRGLLLAGVVAALAFAAFSPYALLHAGDFLASARTQVAYHYQARPGTPPSRWSMLATYAAIWPKALGLPGAILVLAGFVTVRREWRTWAPLAVLPLTTLAVFATQGYRFERHLVPSFGVLALLAGVATDRIAARFGAPAAALAAVLAVGFPLASSVSYVRAISRPGARDIALDWVEAHLPAGSRVVTTVPGFGLDRGRFEVVALKRLTPASRIQVLAADAVVTSAPGDEALVHDLPAAFVARPETRFAGRAVRVRTIPPEARPAYRAVPLGGARLQASQNAPALLALQDGRLDTRWDVKRRPTLEDWVEVMLEAPVRLARIELMLGDRPADAGRGLIVSVSEDGVRWRRIRTLPGRSTVESQSGPPSQVFLFDPVRARGVRVIQGTREGRRWGIAELRLDTAE